MLCSLSDPALADEFDRRAALYTGTKNTYSYTALAGWLEERGVKAPARGTVDRHRKHARNPRDRLVQAVAKRTGGLPAQSHHDEFLTALVAIGADRIAEPPS
jgi:hypothetical protein